MSNATVPSSHQRWPSRRTSDIGLARETPVRLSAPFCCKVAASANRNAAESASAAAMGPAYFASRSSDRATGEASGSVRASAQLDARSMNSIGPIVIAMQKSHTAASSTEPSS